jgi:hypothetical protein
MFRRELLRRSGSLLAVTGVLGLAGCSGDSDEGSDDDGSVEDGTAETSDAGGDGTDEAAGTDTSSDQSTTTTEDGSEGEYVTEASGTVVENTVEELLIRGWQSEVRESAGGEEVFGVTLNIENTGTRETELLEYWTQVELYDEADNELETGGTGGRRTDQTSPGPGEVGVYETETNLSEANPGDVARYEIILNCTLADEAAYCEG